MQKIKSFFKACGAWIKAHVAASVAIGSAAVVAITLAIVLPITLSKKNSDPTPPTPPVVVDDPTKVLDAWKNADDLELNTTIPSFEFNEAGQHREFKIKLLNGEGFHYFQLSVSGSNNSSPAMEYKYFDYKGREITVDGAKFWGTYDGYYYIKISKLDSSKSTFNTFMLKSLDRSIVFGADTPLSPEVNITSTTNPAWFRFKVNSDMRVGFSPAGSSITNVTYAAYAGLPSASTLVELDNTFDGHTSEFKYNFSAKKGYNFFSAVKADSSGANLNFTYMSVGAAVL